MREWRHDYTNHMQLIMTLLEKSKTDEAISYINDISEKITTVASIISTGNYIVDAIVSAKLAVSSSYNINFDYNTSLPEFLDDFIHVLAFHNILNIS